MVGPSVRRVSIWVGHVCGSNEFWLFVGPVFNWLRLGFQVNCYPPVEKIFFLKIINKEGLGDVNRDRNINYVSKIQGQIHVLNNITNFDRILFGTSFLDK